MFVLGKPFQLSLVFVGKAGAYPSDTPLKGRMLALPKNIILGWKGLPGTNALTYLLTYGRKKFYNTDTCTINVLRYNLHL
jgi:hypothetical protein